MPDRESTITHLQIISTWASFARERDLQFFTKKHLEDIDQWARDAIAMLKEQEAKEQCLKTKCIICPHCNNCDVDENGLLKEQESEYEKGFNDAIQGKRELMYEGIDGKWHKKDW